MSRRRFYKFAGVKYEIQYDDLHGLCIRPDSEGDVPEHTIWINPRTKGRTRLDTMIHEALHAQFPDMDESAVADAGTALANMLWGEGYRFVPKKKGPKP